MAGEEGLKEKLAKFNPLKAPVRVAAEGNVRRRYFYLPRFAPYAAFEFGLLELDGGFVWKVPFQVKFTDTPTTLITARGYFRVPLIGITLPLPAWVGEITQEYFTVTTLPVGKYRLAYLAVGPA